MSLKPAKPAKGRGAVFYSKISLSSLPEIEIFVMINTSIFKYWEYISKVLILGQTNSKVKADSARFVMAEFTFLNKPV